MIKAAALDFLSRYSFLLPTVLGEARGKKEVSGGQGLHLFCC